MWLQVFPGGRRREGAGEPGRDVSKQLHGLFGPHQRDPESAGPTLTAVAATGTMTSQETDGRTEKLH